MQIIDRYERNREAIKSVLKVPREGAKRSVKSVLKVPREVAKRSMKSVWQVRSIKMNNQEKTTNKRTHEVWANPPRLPNMLYFGTSKILTNLSWRLQPGQENSKNARHPSPSYLFMTVLHTELVQGLCGRKISLCFVLYSLAGWKTKSAHASAQASQIGSRWHYLCLGCPSKPHTCAIHCISVFLSHHHHHQPHYHHYPHHPHHQHQHYHHHGSFQKGGVSGDWCRVCLRSVKKLKTCAVLNTKTFWEDSAGKWNTTKHLTTSVANSIFLFEMKPKLIEATHWRYERLKEKNGWMFENALTSPKYVVESPEYRFETTQCSSWINSWNWSANWQVRRSGVPDRYHHGKAAFSLVDDCQTMHPPPAELIRKQDRSACDSGFHTHIGPKRGDVSIYQHELATIRKFANCNENFGTF